MADILVVDDDQSVATALERVFAADGHRCRLASSAAEARRALDERQPDLVLMDIRMPGTSGLEALKEFKAVYPGLRVILMTGYGTSQTSIEAIREGAYDYITKPPDIDDLRSLVRRALAGSRRPDRTPVPDEAMVSLVGRAPAMQDLYKMIGRLATNDVPVLIVGEPGTGRRAVAATIHENSARRSQPLVVLDAGIDGDVVLQTLATSAGTVHLAGVENLAPQLQVRLAHMLLPQLERTPGGETALARLVASTERDLADAVAAGQFNRDLHHVLSLITLRLPPLRERREDIPLLVDHFVARFNQELHRTISGVDEAAMRRLRQHGWPGNVGELWRVIRHGAIVAPSDVITEDDLGPLGREIAGRARVADATLTRAARAALLERLEGAPQRSGTFFHEIVELVESTLVKEALAITNGNQLRAAELLGVNRATLRKKAAEG
ncbi:MAG: sigma-54 dependent transcriptional regulator [Acidobacteriota bacterium]